MVISKKFPKLSLAKKQACQEKILIELSTKCCKNNPRERPVFERIVEDLQRALRVLEEPDEKDLCVRLGGCERAKTCVDFLLSNDGLDQEARLIEAGGVRCYCSDQCYSVQREGSHCLSGIPPPIYSAPVE